MHSLYRNLLHASVLGAVERARACNDVTHNGLKGTLREIVVADILRPLLPSDVGIGTGEIITHDGQTSSQYDVIVYDRSLLPPIIFEGNVGLFPVESVAYAIEVKSKLTMRELESAHKAAANLDKFNYIYGVYAEDDHPVKHDFMPAISALFAFNTDLTSSPEEELARYERFLAGSPPMLKSICVAGRGFWDHRNSTGWRTSAAHQFDEIVQFVAQVGNSFRRVLDTRCKPRIGHYLR